MPNFMIIGLATDGPSNVPYKPRDLRELNSLFGGNFLERIWVSQTATSLSLDQEPYSLPLNEVGGKKQYLFAPYLDNTDRYLLSFGALGGTAVHAVDLFYTPYKRQSDLLVAASRYFELTGTMPYVVRLGGTIASLSAQGWTFEARYAGKRYNRLGLSSNGSSMVVFGLEPGYSTKTYTFSTAEEFQKSIQRDFELGTSPILCTVAGTSMLSSGSYWLSSGTDGSFSDADLDNLLANYTFPIEADHILILNPISSSMVTSVANANLEGAQPRMVFVPSISYFGTGSAVEYINSVATAVPYRHNMMTAFVGTITLYYRGERITRYAAEGAAIAYAQSGAFNLTNLPVTAESFSPVLSESNLNLLKSAGFVPLMRYIKNDISVYEGTTTYGENSFLYSSKVAEIAAIAYDYTFQFYGNPVRNGEQPGIAEELSRRLARVRFVEIQSVRVNVQGEAMYVTIEGILPNEILRISFTVQNR